jgi:hypothetical protein
MSIQEEDEVSRLEKEKQYEALFSLDVSSPFRPSIVSGQPKAKNMTKVANTVKPKQPNTSKQRVKRVVVEDVEDNDLSEVDMGNERKGLQNPTRSTRDLTFLSFIDVRKIPLTLTSLVS